jgi:hypothetical protein
LAFNKFAVKGGTDPVLLRGTAKYAKLAKLDQWGKWSCSIYPDAESMNKVHKLISEGIKNKLVKDDDGYRITFSRPAEIKLKSGVMSALDPVTVEDDEGFKVDKPFVEDGSTITMKLETYGGPSPTGFGSYKAARLQGVKVHGMKVSRTIEQPIPH